MKTALRLDDEAEREPGWIALEARLLRRNLRKELVECRAYLGRFARTTLNPIAEVARLVARRSVTAALRGRRRGKLQRDELCRMMRVGIRSVPASGADWLIEIGFEINLCREWGHCCVGGTLDPRAG